MSWLMDRLRAVQWWACKDHYCVVAYYSDSKNCDAYAFRTKRDAEEHVEGLRMLYGWANDVEWHVRPLSTPPVRKSLIKDAVAGRVGKIL